MAILRASWRLGLLLVTVAASPAAAQCCARCGATEGLWEVSCPVYTTMRVEYTEWDCTPEDVSLPRRPLFPLWPHFGGAGPSTCADCDAGHSAGSSPGVACKFFSRNKLVRKTQVKEVPVWKCTIEYVCGQCRGGPAASSAACSGAGALTLRLSDCASASPLEPPRAARAEDATGRPANRTEREGESAGSAVVPGTVER